MRPAILLAAALTATATTALAADNEAGVPLAPSEASGAWSLESGGRRLCTVALGATNSGAGYGAHSDPARRKTLGGDAAGWQPTTDGMRLIAADGPPFLCFSRWSNSLFVSHRSSGVDVQLQQRGRS